MEKKLAQGSSFIIKDHSGNEVGRINEKGEFVGGKLNVIPSIRFDDIEELTVIDFYDSLPSNNSLISNVAKRFIVSCDDMNVSFIIGLIFYDESAEKFDVQLYHFYSGKLYYYHNNYLKDGPVSSIFDSDVYNGEPVGTKLYRHNVQGTITSNGTTYDVEATIINTNENPIEAGDGSVFYDAVNVKSCRFYANVNYYMIADTSNVNDQVAVIETGTNVISNIAIDNGFATVTSDSVTPL